MLPQNTSKVNTECAGLSKQLDSLGYQLLGAMIYLHFIILILICFLLIKLGVNYVIYGCSSLRASPGVSPYTSLTLEEKSCSSYYSR